MPYLAVNNKRESNKQMRSYSSSSINPVGYEKVKKRRENRSVCMHVFLYVFSSDLLLHLVCEWNGTENYSP